MESLARQRVPSRATSWIPRSDRKESAEKRKLSKAVQEFGSYIDANQDFIPNYDDRYRHEEVISTAFVESTVNYVVSKRFVKKQQMRWTQRGAHLLLQTRRKS
jgi:hypothetical protein